MNLPEQTETNTEIPTSKASQGETKVGVSTSRKKSREDNTMKHLDFEIYRDVADAVEECDGDLDAGFARAADESLARQDVHIRLREAGLTPGQVPRVKMTVSYIDTDSNNWTHAQAIFRVSMEVSQKALPLVEREFNLELELEEGR